MSATREREADGMGMVWASAVSEAELELAISQLDMDLSTAVQFAKEQLFGQGRFDLLVNESGHGTGAEALVVAFSAQPLPGFVADMQRDPLCAELSIQLIEEFVHDLTDYVSR